MVIKIKPNDKNVKPTKESRGFTTYLFLLSKNVTGFIKEGQVEDNIFGVFELQKENSMITVYKYLSGVPVLNTSLTGKANELVSPFYTNSREISNMENVFCDLLLVKVGSGVEIQLRPMFVSANKKVVSISSCSYRGLKLLKTRGPGKKKSLANSSKKEAKTSAVFLLLFFFTVIFREK